MATLVSEPKRDELRLLEPGAGTGVLTAAVCEAVAGAVKRLHIDAFELNSVLADACTNTLERAADWLRERGTACTFTVHNTDFLLAPEGESYDVAISNPPYFKLSKGDPRVQALADAVHGQPNIYALFMAAMANRLRDRGEMITITPRSFAAGDYFRRFRKVFFSSMTPEVLHLFQSRRDAFREDAVLQENVIMRARRGESSKRSRVFISSTNGASDLPSFTYRDVPLDRVIDKAHHELTLHIPLEKIDDEILALVREWPASLEKLDLRVSTGPVVAFRATAFIRPEHEHNCVPLLWLQHVRKMHVAWPLRGTKSEYIIDSLESAKLLLPNRTCVVMRRFSAKEEHRRIVAAPLLAGEIRGRKIGLENHLNYIHRPGGEMEEHEAIGLAALLGSALVDRYFRISNGNTQVSAVELRHLPLPSREDIIAIGKRTALDGPDRAVAAVLNLPRDLQEQIAGNA